MLLYEPSSSYACSSLSKNLPDVLLCCQKQDGKLHERFAYPPEFLRLIASRARVWVCRGWRGISKSRIHWHCHVSLFVVSLSSVTLSHYLLDNRQPHRIRRVHHEDNGFRCASADTLMPSISKGLPPRGVMEGEGKSSYFHTLALGLWQKERKKYISD